jgi:hypothetical protein
VANTQEAIAETIRIARELLEVIPPAPLQPRAGGGLAGGPGPTAGGPPR